MSREEFVSIHAPTRGATGAPRAGRPRHGGFNPRPHAGGDPSVCRRPRKCRGCFNPRPHAGGDRRCPAIQQDHPEFQSTPPRGGRPTAPSKKDDVDFVSIHAPTRGATGGFAPGRHAAICFNPRPHAGGDPCRAHRQASRTGFQSTPPRGGRPTWSVAPGGIQAFQSTPPRGGRPPYDGTLILDDMMFQSTPPRGGRPSSCQAS